MTSLTINDSSGSFGVVVDSFSENSLLIVYLKGHKEQF